MRRARARWIAIAQQHRRDIQRNLRCPKEPPHRRVCRHECARGTDRMARCRKAQPREAWRPHHLFAPPRAVFSVVTSRFDSRETERQAVAVRPAKTASAANAPAPVPMALTDVSLPRGVASFAVVERRTPRATKAPAPTARGKAPALPALALASRQEHPGFSMGVSTGSPDPHRPRCCATHRHVHHASCRNSLHRYRHRYRLPRSRWHRAHSPDPPEDRRAVTPSG